MSSTLYNVLSLVLVLGVVRGIGLMSSPKTARQGNLLGAVSLAGAMIITLVQAQIANYSVVLGAVVLGGLIGYWLAIKVTMTQMPQMVALLNALGGGASALVAALTLIGGTAGTLFSGFTSNLGLAVGALTFSGSVIAAGKLAGKLPQRPVQLWQHNLISILFLTVTCALILVNAAGVSTVLVWGVGLGAFALGVVITMRVGGADMPITISLLNSLSGVAGSITGFATSNFLLVAIGAIIGASGLILTEIMCRAMNRKLSRIIFAAAPVRIPTTDEQETSREKSSANQAAESEPPFERCLRVLREANTVVVVPGYGMALAQAQHKVKQFVDILEGMGKEVKIAIHPVAGRMPGHMNVLLAEADLDYDKFVEIDSINPEFANVDVVLVVGANDVVNPAANTAEGTPIYGMPVLEVSAAKHVVVCNFDTKPGYAGVNNPLYELEKATLLLGDATQSIETLNSMLRA